MKKRLGRWLALVLVTSMVLTVAGCASKKKTPAPEKGEEGKQTEGSLSAYDQAIADRKAAAEKSGKYEKVVYAMYTWTGKPAGTERIQEKMNEILREEWGLEIELMVLDFSSYRQNVRLMLSSGEEVDWFGGNALGYTSVINDGYCYDLEEDDLLSVYGPGIKNLISDEYLDACRFSGTLYGIPPMKDYAIVYAALMIGKEYLDAIDYEYVENENQEVVATWEEITDIFAKLHQEFPDKYVFTTGLNTFSQGSVIDPIGGDWFGVLLDPTESLKVENLYESEAWLERLQIMYDWNQKGFFSKDTLTDTTAPSAKVKSGTYMSMLSQSKPGYKSQISGECGKEMIVFRLGDDIIKASGVASTITCMNQGSDDPIAAMQLMDALYTDERLANLFVWGEEGTDYEVMESGHIHFPDGVNAENAEWYHTMNWELPNQYLAHVWEGDPLDLGEKTMEFNNKAPRSLAMGFVFDNSELTAEYTALTNVYDEYAPQLLSGFVEPVEGSRIFVEELKKAGLDKYIAEKQRQLDEWAEENGK